MFIDRKDAGKQLTEKLIPYKSQEPLVIALPRGGVAVGFPIAKEFKIALEMIMVRKIGAPQNPELGIGAIAEGNVLFWDTDMLDIVQIPNHDLVALYEKESAELARRIDSYRRGKQLPLLTNKTIILVDDGLATGVSAHAALLSLKRHHPKKIIFALPVCSGETALSIRQLVDKVICLESSDNMESIGRYYENFEQVTDDTVMTLIKKTKNRLYDMEVTENNFSHKIVW